ncbi:MAG: DUF4296 domain-containing protein [Sphingobacteriales bacterium]|nr:DUF4296 domain-containing protein [Sphingobacteriales bacterium]
MRKGLFLVLMMAALFSGCKKKEAVPAKLLSRQQMEDVLWDLMRADLFINNYLVVKDTALDKKKQEIELYSKVLKLHKVSQDLFRESFRYYRSHPMLLKDLMDTLNRRTDTNKLKKPGKLLFPADSAK